MKQKFKRITQFRLMKPLVAALLLGMALTSILTGVVKVGDLSHVDKAKAADPNGYNYVIPEAPNEDGPRLVQKIVDPSSASEGTAPTYIPGQYWLASSSSTFSFQIRDGQFLPGTGIDYNDTKDWVFNNAERSGYDSPIYYEVYQLTNGDVHNGTLLGVINPRDDNIFPGSGWRQFTIGPGGGDITQNDAQQRSCAKRLANHNNQCYSGSPIAMAGSSPYSHLFARNDVQAGQPSGPAGTTVYSTVSLPVWENYFSVANDFEGVLASRAPPGVAKPPIQKPETVGAAPTAHHKNGLLDSIFGQIAKADPSTHSITVNVNPASKVSGNVTVSVASGNNGSCTDSSKPVGASGSVTFGGCLDGHMNGQNYIAYSYTVSVDKGSFDVPNGACGIDDSAKKQNIGGGGSATFTYTCNHQITVTVSPTGHTTNHVHVELFGKDGTGNCNKTSQVVGADSNPAGIATFYGCPDGGTFRSNVDEDRFDDQNGDFHCEIGNNPKTIANIGDDAKASFKYDCYQAIANDGWINGANFGGVDSNNRFNSNLFPNLNGYYVFMVKTVHYQDLANGVVLSYSDQFVNGTGDNRGCVNGDPGNVVSCPTNLLHESLTRSNQNKTILNNGFYLRTFEAAPGGGVQYMASAPTELGFGVQAKNINNNNENGGLDPENQLQLYFSSSGINCHNDAATGLNRYYVYNADYDRHPSFDTNLGVGVVKVNSGTTNGYLIPAGYQPDVSTNWRTGLWTFDIRDADSRASSGSTDFYNWPASEGQAGVLYVANINMGNLIYQGGLPFTRGFWPTCRQPVLTPLTPKSFDSGYPLPPAPTTGATRPASAN